MAVVKVLNLFQSAPLPGASAPWERLGVGGASGSTRSQDWTRKPMGKVVSVASKLRRDRARRLRRDQTDAEARLWEALRAAGWTVGSGGARRRSGPSSSIFLAWRRLWRSSSMARFMSSRSCVTRGGKPIFGRAACRCCGSGTRRSARTSTGFAGRSWAPAVSLTRRAAGRGSIEGSDPGATSPSGPTRRVSEALAPPTPSLSHDAARLGEERVS